MQRLVLVLLLPLIGLATAAWQLDWSTMDAGGGSSTGGAFAVHGTIGQPDAATSSGGPYVVHGGFWAAPEVIPVPGAPELLIAPGSSAGTYQVSWIAPSPGWRLETSAIPGSWSPVATAPALVSGRNVVVVPAGNRLFYRLSLP
jgi:hypothetical protein